jgi:hypothetical protein
MTARIWDVHVQFEETEMENGKVAIRQAVNTAIERCLSTVRTEADGKLGCTFDYGDLDYISLTFNVTTQKIASDLSRSMPFQSVLQCNIPKKECHTIILFLVGWWFGSRHSILFGIVLSAFMVFVCIFIFPIVVTMFYSGQELVTVENSKRVHRQPHTGSVRSESIRVDSGREMHSYVNYPDDSTSSSFPDESELVRRRVITPQSPPPPPLPIQPLVHQYRTLNNFNGQVEL